MSNQRAEQIVNDWSRYPNFTRREFACGHTGMCLMCTEFVDLLQTIRTAYGKPMRITSGYRHPTHPIEWAKGHDQGEHTRGRCADVAVSGGNALELLSIALAHGITRVGVQQKGTTRFLHLGIGGPGLATPAFWSY